MDALNFNTGIGGNQKQRDKQGEGLAWIGLNLQGAEVSDLLLIDLCVPSFIRDKMFYAFPKWRKSTSRVLSSNKDCF